MYYLQALPSITLTLTSAVIILDIFVFRSKKVDTWSFAQYITCAVLIIALSLLSPKVVCYSNILALEFERMVRNTEIFLETISSILTIYAVVNFILSLVLGTFELAGKVVNILLLSGLGIYVRVFDPVTEILLILLYFFQKLLIVFITVRDVLLIGKYSQIMLPLTLLAVPKRTRGIGLVAMIIMIGITTLVLLLYGTFGKTMTMNTQINSVLERSLGEILHQVNKTLSKARDLNKKFSKSRIIQKICSDTDLIIISDDGRYATYVLRGCINTMILSERRLKAYVVCKEVSDNIHIDKKTKQISISTGFRRIIKGGEIEGYIRCKHCLSVSVRGNNIILEVPQTAEVELISGLIAIYRERGCNITVSSTACNNNIKSLLCLLPAYYTNIKKYSNMSSYLTKYSRDVCRSAEVYRYYKIDITCNRSYNSIMIKIVSGLRISIPTTHNINATPPYIYEINNVVRDYLKYNIVSALKSISKGLKSRETIFLGALFRDIVETIIICAICAVLLPAVLGSDVPVTHVLSIFRKMLLDLTAVQISRAIRFRFKVLKILNKEYVMHRVLLHKIERLETRTISRKIPNKVLRRVAIYPKGSRNIRGASVRDIIAISMSLSNPLDHLVWDLAHNLARIRGERTCNIVAKGPLILFRKQSKNIRDIITLSLILRLTPLDIIALSLDKNILHASILNLFRKANEQQKKMLLRLYLYSTRGPSSRMFRDYVKTLSFSIRRLLLEDNLITGVFILKRLAADVRLGKFSDRTMALLYRYLPLDLLRELLFEYRRCLRRYPMSHYRLKKELTKITTLLRLLRDDESSAG